MDASNLFLIEVHRKEYLGQLQHEFSNRGLKLVQVNQSPLFFVGQEQREETNWWLVSDMIRQT
jgi:hypothetical protein